MLDRTSLRILDLLYEKPNMEEMELRKNFNGVETGMQYLSSLDYLKGQGYLMKGASNNGTVYRLSPTGTGTVEERKRAFRDKVWTEIRLWVALGISVAAFIKSFFF